MKCGFNFELNDVIYTNCFIESSLYPNGNLQLSLFGTDPAINETAHIIDITLEHNALKLPKDEIIVDCYFRPTLVAQLKELKVIKEQTGSCIVNLRFYPVYTIDLTKVAEKKWYMYDLVAA